METSCVGTQEPKAKLRGGRARASGQAQGRKLMSAIKTGSNAKKLRIAIVGGGIGGLTLALALRQRGIVSDVYEQAPELTEIGAAVALSANSTRELDRLGLLDQLTAVCTEPTE